MKTLVLVLVLQHPQSSLPLNPRPWYSSLDLPGPAMARLVTVLEVAQAGMPAAVRH